MEVEIAQNVMMDGNRYIILAFLADGYLLIQLLRSYKICSDEHKETIHRDSLQPTDSSIYWRYEEKE